jgi:hypothetical protein
MSASTNSIKQEPNIKEEYDSCYDASTDDEEPNSNIAAVLKSEEDQMQDDPCLQEEANCCSAFNNSEGDCKESDGEDSIDLVLFDHYNAPEAYVAFCCQNCT